ncbi:MAG: hypothetical protein IJU40_06755 [Desulfovibrionaceae bacterium]|nr:hypothetical protein [Desulfovibrionaceae bacterium]
MKILCAISCLILSLALATPSLAEIQTFGPDFSRFNVDVPAGWTAKPNDGGCQITSKDGATSVSIQVHKSGGQSALTLAQAISKEMEGKVVKIEEEKDDPTKVTIYAEVDGLRVAVCIAVEGDKFLAITMAGSDSASIKKIVNSLSDAK